MSSSDLAGSSVDEFLIEYYNDLGPLDNMREKILAFQDPTSLFLRAAKIKLYSLATFLLNERKRELDLEKTNALVQHPHHDDETYHRLLARLGFLPCCGYAFKRKSDGSVLGRRKEKKPRHDPDMAEWVRKAFKSLADDVSKMPALEFVPGISDASPQDGVFSMGEKPSAVWPIDLTRN